MFRQKARVFVALAVIATTCITTKESQATGPVLDWFCNLFRPATTAYYVPATNACTPTTALSVTDNCCPQTTTCCTPQVTQCLQLQYEARTSYRSSWVQVPVTTYRQVASVDPCTGCQTTVLRPCTSQSWQLRRVPTTTYRPVYRTVNMVSSTNCCTPVATDDCCTTPGATIVPSPGATIVPSPGATIIPSPSDSGTTPADQQPTITPSGNTLGKSQGSGTRVYVPQTVQAKTQVQPPRPSLAEDNKTVVSTQRGFAADDSPPYVPPAPPYVPPSAWTLQPSNETTAQPTVDLNNVIPLPDPEGDKKVLTPSLDAPQLLDPHDKTAAFPVRRTWTYTPVKTTSLTQPEVKSRPSESKVEAKPKWDSSGWKSVRN